ncbi:MAG TPA: hypothetical protein PLB97_02355 [Accumulibacter sp.]|nr:hypothetical protein [Accumulibacter sp.]
MTQVSMLVEGASLPAALQPLHEWNARPTSEDGWEDDIRRLIGEIAEATHLPVGPELETLLQDAGTAQQRLASKTPYPSANSRTAQPAADRHRT